KKLVTAPAPATLYQRTSIGNSLWIHLLVWKFLHGVPTERILKNLALYKLKLSAGTIAGGMKKLDELLTPLYEEIVDYCKGQDFLNADETSWRVFDQDRVQHWFWVFGNE